MERCSRSPPCWLRVASRVTSTRPLQATTGAGFEGDEGGQGLPGDGGDGAVGDDDDDDAVPPDPEDPEAVDPPAECDTSESVSLFLSPDDSNSMSSPVQAREAALDGFSALKDVPVRPWEFMNYYTFDYAPAESGQVVVTPSLVADPSFRASTPCRSR